jgi:hypothetical protein
MVNITRAADLAQVGANGGGWVADLGTAAPAGPLTQPLSPWLPLGAISDDGLVQGFDEESQEYTPWGFTSPFRTQITKSLRTFKLTAWETARTTVQSLQYRIPIADLTPVGGKTTFAETASVLVHRPRRRHQPRLLRPPGRDLRPRGRHPQAGPDGRLRVDDHRLPRRGRQHRLPLRRGPGHARLHRVLTPDWAGGPPPGAVPARLPSRLPRPRPVERTAP